MNVSKVNAMAGSIYDRSGMIQVARMTKDFATTSNGQHIKGSARITKKMDSADHDFEAELERAINEGNEDQRVA
jgi:hypothetical protein